MPTLIWQKSSYSGSGQNDCIEIAADSSALWLRESEEPTATLAPTGDALTRLLHHIKAGDGPCLP